MNSEHNNKIDKDNLYRIALNLAIFTITYNVIEGIIATVVGYSDESLSLFGFGVDSFIEVISGFGIAHMMIRIKRIPQIKRDDFERTALRITGSAFYFLVVGLVITSIYNVFTGNKPETTFWGVIISIISIVIMLLLIKGKVHIGRALNSEAILADAQCTKVCIYMSVILLISSGVYELSGFIYMDSIGSLGIAWFAFDEGRECFIKAKSDKLCSCD